MSEPAETSWSNRIFQELTDIYDDREKAERLLKDAGYPASRIPNNSHTLLDFWERVRHEIRAGIISDGLWPILARAHTMYPGNEVFKPSQGPKKIFVSYRTNATLDKQVCEMLVQRLGEAGHHVFFDRKIAIGTAWVAEIEREIRNADAVILLLTKDSCLSEMFFREVEMAYKVATARQGLPRLLPVRVAFTEALPYPLSSYISPLQYAQWNHDGDTERLIAAIESSLRNEARDPSASPPEVRELTLGLQPLPQAQIYKTTGGRTGTLVIDDPFYVRRSADEEGLRAIQSGPGQTISIKGARQMGKSSLFVRLLHEMKRDGRSEAYIDCGLLNGTWETSSSFFRHFATTIAGEFNLPGPAGNDWDADSPANSCTRFVEKQVLAHLNAPLVLACDEVDVVLGYRFHNEFFSMLRSWHNRRARPGIRGTNPWRSLDILLVTSTEPYLLIDRPEQSPFNVGTVLTLEDFSVDDLWQLNERFDKPLVTREEAEQLHELTGGQAYLTRRALYLMTPEGGRISLRALQTRGHDEQGPFGDHLRMLLSKIVSSDALVAAFKAVLDGRNDRNGKYEPSLLRLASAGLIKRSASGFVPRCGLYARYFEERLGAHG